MKREHQRWEIPPGATHSLSSNEIWICWMSRKQSLVGGDSFQSFLLRFPCFYFSSSSSPLLSLSDCVFNVPSTPNPLLKWNSFDLLGWLKTFKISSWVIHRPTGSCRPVDMWTWTLRLKSQHPPAAEMNHPSFAFFSIFLCRIRTSSPVSQQARNRLLSCVRLQIQSEPCSWLCLSVDTQCF